MSRHSNNRKSGWHGKRSSGESEINPRYLLRSPSLEFELETSHVGLESGT